MQNNTPEYTCFYMSTFTAPNLKTNSYLKFSATLSDLDGTGCSGCCSESMRIASFNKEEADACACELPAAILQRSWAVPSPLTYNVQTLGTLCSFAFAFSLFALCLFPFCLCVLPLHYACLSYAYFCFASLRYACLRDASLHYACLHFASLYDAFFRVLPSGVLPFCIMGISRIGLLPCYFRLMHS